MNTWTGNVPLLANLSFGAFLIIVSVMIHTLGLIALTRASEHMNRYLHHRFLGRMLAIQATVLGIFMIHTIEIWMWALAYWNLESFEEAVYFSTVTFSTIGFGDVILPHQWRVFSSLEGINGFLLIGWSTAYLVAASTRHGPFRLGEHF